MKPTARYFRTAFYRNSALALSLPGVALIMLHISKTHPLALLGIVIMFLAAIISALGALIALWLKETGVVMLMLLLMIANVLIPLIFLIWRINQT